MELRPGYKQTEMRVIPEDWEIATIQELLDRGAVVGHLDGNHGELYPRSHEFKEFGVPYITANDLCGRKVSFRNCKYLSKERASRFRKGVARNGDVLFAHNATVGPTALLSTELDSVILSTTATYFRCNQDKLINLFLLYALQSTHFVGQYQAVMAQSTRNQVPITAQRKLSVALPPTKAEQEAIAEALSDADALIEALEQLIAKKCHIKQGAMQELLTGKRRLTGSDKAWEIRRLADVCRSITDGTHFTPHYVESGVPFYSVENVTRDDFVNTKFISENEHFNLIKRCRPERGDLLLTRIGDIGKAKLIDWDVNASIYVSLALIKLKPELNAQFV